MSRSIKKFRPSKKSRYKDGIYDVSKSKKYHGDLPCIYRSSWEFAIILFLERNEKVLRWSSEPFGIPYTNPVTKKKHNYFIDFTAELDDGTKWLLEIKPYAQTVPQKGETYARNALKWKAARELCENKGWKFSIVTEKGHIIKQFLRK